MGVVGCAGGGCLVHWALQQLMFLQHAKVLLTLQVFTLPTFSGLSLCLLMQDCNLLRLINNRSSSKKGLLAGAVEFRR